MGVDVTVLQALENDLWDEMNTSIEDDIACQAFEASMVYEEDKIIPIHGEVIWWWQGERWRNTSI